MSWLSGSQGPGVPTFYIESYGCQMNLADSEIIGGALTERGYRPVAEPETASVILLNTCAIRENAERRVAQRVRQLIAARNDPGRVRIGLAGCMAQHHRDRLLERIPGLDFVVGPDGYRRLGDLLEADDPVAHVRLDPRETYEGIVPLRGEGPRAWVTIMRGCDRFCTFCVVPYVRGRERSLPAEVITTEVRQAAADGYREVVLLGQTVNSYHDGSSDFGELLRNCAAVEGIERVRFTSPHPADMTESAIAAMAECPEVCPYIHLPLQSGSDRILADMERGYTTGQYRALVAKLRSAIDELAISTDIIVGYPGETENDFEATSTLMNEIDFDHAFLFKYSRREATKAWNLEETVSEEEKGARLTRLIEEQERRSAAWNQAFVGRKAEVLIEGSAKRQTGWLAGKNPQFKTVVFEPTRPGLRVGETVPVSIEAAGSHTLRGRELASV